MIWLLAYRVGWFPITGMLSPEVWIDPQAGFVDKALDVLHHMALPLMTLILIHFGSYLLVMRSSISMFGAGSCALPGPNSFPSLQAINSS